MRIQRGAAAPDTTAGLPRRPTTDRLLAAASLGWLLALPLVPGDADWAVWGTLGMLAANAAAGVGVLIRRKRLPLLLGVAQFALFGASHYQVYTAWGPHHYTWDRPPGPLDWGVFAVAHALRAADVLDYIDEYGIDWQNVRHASPASGGLLVAMHLTVDAFVIGFLVRHGGRVARELGTRLGWRWNRFVDRVMADGVPGQLARRHRRKARGEAWAKVLTRGPAVGLAGCAVAYLLIGAVRGWGVRDWVSWPIDALLRLIDAGDAMNVFHWQLHRLPPDPWLSALAVSLRLVVAIYLTEQIVLLRLRLLKGALRTTDELIDDLSHTNPEVRVAAVEILARQGALAPDIVPGIVGALGRLDPYGPMAAANVLVRIGPPAVPALIPALGDKSVRGWAALVLEKLGPTAAPATTALLRERARSTKDHDFQTTAESALGRIGPAAVPALVAALAEPDPAVRSLAASVLGRVGPAAAQALPALVAALDDPDAGVRDGATTAVKAIKPPGRA